jgi:tRNA modification GTPase
MVTFFPAPHSYTGDDVIEISAHGSPVVLNAIVSAVVSRGGRVAAPGEFTLRAFLNGRLDLPQAEAVADLIDAATPLQARAAFDQLNGTLSTAIGEIDAQLFDLIAKLEASVDFPDEGYHFVEPGEVAAAIARIVEQIDRLLIEARSGRVIREGLRVAIVGAPNVGKSSLFNALVGSARAIVTEIPGTTRDLVSETIDLDGLRVTLVDTAGLRETADVVEAEGVNRSTGAARAVDLVLVVADLSRDGSLDEARNTLQNIDNKGFIVGNKSDLAHRWSAREVLEISAVSGDGLDLLRHRVAEEMDVELRPEPPAMTNVRHIALMESARIALERARSAASAAGGSLPEEFVLADLQEARERFDEISGKRTADDILSHIFSRFCIGK